MEQFKRELIIYPPPPYYFMPCDFFHHPYQLVNHAKAEHFISQNMFAPGHSFSKLVLSIYAGKS